MGKLEHAEPRSASRRGASDILRREREPSAKPIRIDGTVFLSSSRPLYLYVGPLVATKRHAHHAAQILLAPQGMHIEDGTGRCVRACAAVIPPRVPHCHGASAHSVLLHLDGDDQATRELSRNADPHCETWVRDMLDVTVPRDPTPESARAVVAAIFAALDLRQPSEHPHPAARRMCALLDDSNPVDLASLSRKAGLSPRQMRHIFSRDVGLSMRAYLRWKRLRLASAAVERGASLTAAAVSAGFADSAHLTRVFREHFGMTPTQGMGAITWQRLD